jgi:hypothetical protein
MGVSGFYLIHETSATHHLIAASDRLAGHCFQAIAEKIRKWESACSGRIAL